MMDNSDVDEYELYNKEDSILFDSVEGIDVESSEVWDMIESEEKKWLEEGISLLW